MDLGWGGSEGGRGGGKKGGGGRQTDRVRERESARAHVDPRHLSPSDTHASSPPCAHAKEHNLVVCTLCSCYPAKILGLSPQWYKSRVYRARAVREPRAVLREFGTDIPSHVRVRVHDSTADCRYLVLPGTLMRASVLHDVWLMSWSVGWFEGSV